MAFRTKIAIVKSTAKSGQQVVGASWWCEVRYDRTRCHNYLNLYLERSSDRWNSCIEMDSATFIGNNLIQYGEAIYKIESTEIYEQLIELNKELEFPAKVRIES